MVMVELPEPGAGIGLRIEAHGCACRHPEADRLIALLKPPLMALANGRDPLVSLRDAE